MYIDYYMYYLSYFSTLYTGYPLVIRITVIMVTVLLAITLFGFLRLLFMGYKLNRKAKRRKETREHFEDKLSFVMKSRTNYDIEEVQELLEYDVHKTRRWKAEILTDLVLNVKNEITKLGELNEINYRNCLEALRLMGFWEKRIKISNVNKRKEALQVVGLLDNGVNTGILSKSTFHKDDQLRKAARDLYTSQDSYNPFRFMEENFDEAFTQLDKLRLHATLVKRSKESKLPNLLRWINNSKNPNYIIFIVKEISYFDQKETAPKLLEVLKRQENREIRAQIILTLGDLEYEEAIPQLIERFELESATIREAIIVTMGKIQTSTALDFLVHTYDSVEDVDLKILIARSLKKHGKEGERMLQKLKLNARSKEESIEGSLLEQVMAEKNVATF